MMMMMVMVMMMMMMMMPEDKVHPTLGHVLRHLRWRYCFVGKQGHTLWSEEEKDAVFKSLEHWVRRGRVPGKLDCEKCISKANGALERRDWTAVKYFIKNQISKRNKILLSKNHV